MPALPRELIDSIIDYFRNDIPSLLSCFFTCRAWYHSAMRHWKQPDVTYEVTDQSSLHRVSRALTVKKTRRLYAERVVDLRVCGDATRTFAFQIPGEYLTLVEVLVLCDGDWEKRRPHPHFFIDLTRFASVTSLRLEGCRFHSSGQLRALIRALPNLVLLHLARIQAAQLEPVITQHEFARSYLRLRFVGLDGLTCHKARMAALAVCCACALDVELRVYMNDFGSWSHFLEFAQAIPTFAKVDLYMSGTSWWPAVTDTIPLPGSRSHLRLTTLSNSHSIARIFPRDGSDRALHAVLYLINVSSSHLHHVDITVWRQPSREVELRLEELIQRSSEALTNFKWNNRGGSYMPSLAFSTHLEVLDIILLTKPESLKLRQCCTLIASILSQVTIPAVKTLSIRLRLDTHSSDEPEAFESSCLRATFKIPGEPVDVIISRLPYWSNQQKAFVKAAYEVVAAAFLPYCEHHGGLMTTCLINVTYGRDSPEHPFRPLVCSFQLCTERNKGSQAAL